MTWERLILPSPRKKTLFVQIRLRGVLATGDWAGAPWLQQHSKSNFFRTPCSKGTTSPPLPRKQWVQNITISKYWNTKILECQNIGISEYPNIRLSHLVCKGSSWFQKCAIGITNAFVSCHQHHMRPSLSCQFRHLDFQHVLRVFSYFLRSTVNICNSCCISSSTEVGVAFLA